MSQQTELEFPGFLTDDWEVTESDLGECWLFVIGKKEGFPRGSIKTYSEEEKQLWRKFLKIKKNGKS